MLMIFAIGVLAASFAIPFLLVREKTKKAALFGLGGAGVYLVVGWLVRSLLTSGDASSGEGLAQAAAASRAGMGAGLVGALVFGWIARAKLGREASSETWVPGVARQIAGSDCAHCKRTIAIGAEGRRCKQCGDVVHKRCAKAHRAAQHG